MRRLLSGSTAAILAVTALGATPSASAADPSAATAGSQTQQAAGAAAPRLGPGGTAWLDLDGGTFSVDTASKSVRFRTCSDDSAPMHDPDMRVSAGSVSGQVTAGSSTYAYRLPTREGATGTVRITGKDREPTRAKGSVTTNTVPGAPGSERQVGDWERLRQRLQEITYSTPNTVGVSVEDLSGRGEGRRIDVNGSARLVAASVIKIPLLVELLRQVDCGGLALDDTIRVEPDDVVGGAGELQNEEFPQDVSVRRLARYMIIYSDNTATNVLIDELGFDAVNALIDTMGLRQTSLQRKMMDTEAPEHGRENYIAAADINDLLQAVWDERLLSASSRETMLSFLRDQTVNNKMPAGLPPGAPVAHKTGELEDVVSHDVGYYLLPGKEVAVSFTTAGRTESAEKAIRELARAVWDFND